MSETRTTNVTPEQRKELRRKWVAALRSGKYTQGRKCLREGDKFCCLGVACEVVGKVVALVVSTNRNGGITYYDGEAAAAPQKVMDAIGLRSPYGTHGGKPLVVMNDAGVPFSKIADIIEAEPPGLFVD